MVEAITDGFKIEVSMPFTSLKVMVALKFISFNAVLRVAQELHKDASTMWKISKSPYF